MKKFIVLFFIGLFACAIDASAQTSSTPQTTADETAFKDLVGKYKFDDAPFEEVIVTFSNGKLYGEAVGQGSAELKATLEADVYEVVGYDGKVKFVRNGSVVEKIELTIQGQTMIGEKQP